MADLIAADVLQGAWPGLLRLTYAIDGLREVLIKGADLSSAALRLDLLVLAGVAVLLAVVASLTIRREVA